MKSYLFNRYQQTYTYLGNYHHLLLRIALN